MPWPWLALAMVSCQPVRSDRITVGQLATAIPILRQAPAAAEIGFAPLPGQQRTFSEAEIRRLLNRYGLPESDARSACFAWPMAALDKNRVRTAMVAALASPEATIELVEIGPHAAPTAGNLVFPRETLARAVSGSAAVWKGYVEYAPGRRYWIWARARIQIRGTRVVVARRIAEGERLAAADVRVEEYSGSPLSPDVFTRPEQTVGMIARRSLAEGSIVSKLSVQPPLEVHPGDVVRVHVHSGSAQLQLDARAVNGARRGETVILMNTSTRRSFKARVDSAGIASIEIGNNSHAR